MRGTGYGIVYRLAEEEVFAKLDGSVSRWLYKKESRQGSGSEAAGQEKLQRKEGCKRVGRRWRGIICIGIRGGKERREWEERV